MKSKIEFLEDISNHKESFVVTKWLLDSIPHIFDDSKHNHILWKEKVASLLKVDSSSIILVGSSALGFSLNPTKNFKEFTKKSDIDIAIISHHYFSLAWHSLRNLGTEKYYFSPEMKNSIADHVSRLIYWGTIATDKILPILPFSKQWYKAIDEIKKMTETEDRNINFRIYSDFDSLRAYQIDSIKKIRMR
ncbi:MAG: hypothetical protein O9275_23840 [Microcystis sp. LE19-196.1B]|nr:hypothetical protein [Microcystis sp. LE19-196.1B]